ncbi:hypothetical protein G7Y89_g15739 [Cudoniella acicularis]|uniref:Uncharacterized protein n=1 Tax=Cudoniella acicularis TaxID=354080 RepID=A0A8H4VJP3_9HELO|nr:hypothetical protein G7Y89_g15739 [Cudoniella acicularis]
MSSSSTPPEDVPATMDAPSSPSRPKPTRSSTTKSQVSLSNPRPGNLIRKASNSFSQSRPPVGMFHAFGSVGSNIPTLNDIQKGNFNPEGWSGPGQRRNSQAHRESDTEVLELRRQRTMSVAAGTVEKIPVIKEKEDSKEDSDDISGIETGEISTTKVEEDAVITPHDPSIPYANGYQFPPHHTKKQATLIALHGFWNFVTTPFGFLLTLYALNIVAWGGMLFLILIHATPAMAYPSYNALNSPAKIWLEITAQILNALFCVTGLGLIPWRFRDAWFALRWRFDKGKGSEESLRKLAGIHRNWFRLRGSQEVNVLFDPSSFSSSNVENNDDNSLPPNIPPLISRPPHLPLPLRPFNRRARISLHLLAPRLRHLDVRPQHLLTNCPMRFYVGI